MSETLWEQKTIGITFWKLTDYGGFKIIINTSDILKMQELENGNSLITFEKKSEKKPIEVRNKIEEFWTMLHEG